MSERIASWELPDSIGEVLRAVSGGATFEVTHDGRVVAVIAPPPSDESGGLRIIPAHRPQGWPRLPTRRSNTPTAVLLDELRADTV